jgi:Fe-S-cluster containining protein
MKPKPRNTSHTSRTARPAGKAAGAGRPGAAGKPGPAGKAGSIAKPGLAGKADRAGKASAAGKPTPTVKTAWSKSAARARTPEAEDFSVTSCECDHCRAACLNAPGWFMPDQIPRLARKLRLTVEETFRKYLAIGVTQLADGTQKAGVMPHKLRDGKKPGARWSLGEIAGPGRCIFYDRGRCSIYAVRPFECARMMHDRGDGAVRLRRQIVPRWTAAAIAPFLEWVRSSVPGRGEKR